MKESGAKTTLLVSNLNLPHVINVLKTPVQNPEPLTYRDTLATKCYEIVTRKG